MRSVLPFILILFVYTLFVEGSSATQYPNRVLISCKPLIYKIEPIERIGTDFILNRSWSNEYGDCTGEPPGPPFVFEMPLTVDNAYNPDGSVMSLGYFGVDNSWGGGEPFEIKFLPGAPLTVNGNLIAKGKPGDPVMFKFQAPFYSTFQGGTSSPPEDFTYEFEYCDFFNYTPSDPTLQIAGGHLKLSYCTITGVEDRLALDHHPMRDGWYDATINDCYFNNHHIAADVSPNQLVGIRNLTLNNNRFSNCLFGVGTVATGVLEVGGNFTLKSLTGNTAANNSRNNIVFNSTRVTIDDSCTIRTTDDFTPYFLGEILVDTTGTLIVDTGSVLQMNPMTTITVQGKMVVDGAVITSVADRAYGVTSLGLSSDEPQEIYAWYGFDQGINSELEIRNSSRIRWAQGAITGEGNLSLDHSTIEQIYGTVIDKHYTSPCSVQVVGSTIHQIIGAGEGIDFTMSINSADSASGFLLVDSSEITGCGSDGIYLGGGAGRPLEDNLSVRITSSSISGCAGSGVFGYLGPPADSIIVLNNRFIGNGGNGFWIEDNGCDSMHVRLETNASAGNGGSGLGVETGFVEVVGNTSAFNDSYGIYYPYKPQRFGHIVNNLLAFNDGAGVYCYAKYGGIMPELSHNIFWQNYDAAREMNVRSDEHDIYTVPELQALGGTAVSNTEVDPQFYPAYTAKTLSYMYDEGRNQTKLLIDGPFVEFADLEGLPVLPTQADSTGWFYVVRNTNDSVHIAGDIRDVITGMDSLTVYDYHIRISSPAVEYGDTSYVTTSLDVDGHDRIIDADANGTKLVDVGADEFDTDTTNIMLFVMSPTKDTTLVPGSTVDIYFGTYGIQNVKIDYALDIRNGQAPNWQILTPSVAVNLGLFPWTIPDTLSYRTKIRVSDVGGSGFSAESDYFHIKPPYLTRVTADSAYERYLPSQHSWQLNNDSVTIWPDTWFNQFDYMNGIDPYTSKQYPSDDFAYPFGVTSAREFPDWPLFVDVFTENTCYNNTPSGLMYTMRSVTYWDEVSGVWNGSCLGLSTSSLLAFLDHAGLQALWPGYIIPEPLHNETLDDDSRYFINSYQIKQFGKAEGEKIASAVSNDVLGTVSAVEKMLLGNPDSVVWLGIGCQTDDCWHAMAAYAVGDHADPSAISIRVYDPNRPGVDTSTVRVDTLSKVWYYSGFPGWGGNKNLILGYAVRYSLDDPELKRSAGRTFANQENEQAGAPLRVVYDNDCEVMLYDMAGDSIGYNAIGGVRSIDDAGFLIALEGENAPPYGFVLPGYSYKTVLAGSADSVIRVGYFYDSLSAVYSRYDAEPTQRDSIVVNQSVTVYNPDEESRMVRIGMVRTLAAGERAVVIDSLAVDSSGGVRLEPIDTTGWYLVNGGNACTYRLWMRQVGAVDGEWKFRAHDVPLDGGKAHLLTPDWGSLNDDSCTIYLDSDGDYLADDSLVLHTDIVLGMEDGPEDGIPFRFELSQNYPNPFNPVTRIEYSLPRRCEVTIDIFNVLGQKVRTLVDRMEAAGTYAVTWDGTNTSGQAVATGVYLYRIEAGDYIKTKKMLLLK